MKPHPSEELLNDYVDDLLEPGRRQEIERHVAGCPDCTQSLDELRSLLRRAAELPEVRPGRDLLPGVRAGIGGGAASWPRWLAVAAAVFGVALVLTLGWVRRDHEATTAAPSGHGNQRFLQELAVAEAQYVEATDRLLTLLQQRRGEIPASTRQVFDENLRVIDQAIDQTRAALDADDAGADDGHRLAALYGKKLDLLLRASRLANEG